MMRTGKLEEATDRGPLWVTLVSPNQGGEASLLEPTVSGFPQMRGVEDGAGVSLALF